MSNLTTIAKSDDVTEANQVTKAELVAVYCILSSLSVFGTFGNGLVLYVFSRKVDKITSTLFILTLAGTDFITCLLIIPFTLIYIWLDGWIRLDFFCKLYQFLITCNVPLSAFVMVAIAVDRYLCICHPFVRAMTVKRAKVAILCLSLFAFLLGTITSLIYGVVEPQKIGENATVESPNSSYPWKSDKNGSLRMDWPYTINNDKNVSDTGNTSHIWSQSSEENIVYVYSGKCSLNTIIWSRSFFEMYQKVYASFFLISILIVSVLYTLIYRSVIQRRKWRWRQRSQKPSMKSMATCHTEVEEVELCTATDNNGVAAVSTDEKQNLQKSKKVNGKEKRDYNRLANIRTAAMLFVVTVVFIIAFLPAWLMAHKVIAFNIVVFYMYFVYNVANPVIYAFMNVAFRKELKEVFTRGSSCMTKR